MRYTWDFKELRETRDNLVKLYNDPNYMGNKDEVESTLKMYNKMLKLANKKDDVLTVEKKLEKIIPKNLWSRSHHQLVLFGRYTCKARMPLCENCLFYNDCKSKDKKRLNDC